MPCLSKCISICRRNRSFRHLHRPCCKAWNRRSAHLEEPPVNVIEESARTVKCHLSVTETLTGEGQVTAIHSACDSHIQQPAFFFYLLRLDAELRREEILFQTGDKDNREFQTFGGMNCHQCHALGSVRQVVILVRQQTDLTQEIRNRRIIDTLVLTLFYEFPNGVQQLLYILRAVNAFLCVVQS